MATFESLGLNDLLLKSIKDLGFENPTEVQEKAIPVLLQQSTDLIALAQTGTGKTAAFGFPILQKIDPENLKTQALVLSPTRELCLQITNDIGLYGRTIPKIKAVAIYGGANITEQGRKIKRGAHIVVATPGRLKDMIKRKLVNISAIEYCVLDEADEMLNMGFYEDIMSILSNTPKTKKSWLFSATMPPEVNKIASKFMNKPHEISLGKKNSAPINIEHQYYVITSRERYQALRAIISTNLDIFGCVFCRTKIETQRVAEKLISDGIKAAAIHGDLSQNQRDEVMNSFRKKKIQLLIATDVAARGIDVDDITHVINYQLPDEVEVYTHRSGRTGRAGKNGISIILVTKSDRRKITLIENKLQTKIKEVSLPSKESILKNEIENWIEKVKKTPLKIEITEFIPEVLSNFEELSKADILELFLSRDLKRNEPIINYSQNKKENKNNSEKSYKKSNSKTDRFFINVGSRDKYDWQSLKDFLRSFLELSNEAVFQVEVMKNFSFFSVDNEKRQLVFDKFSNFNLDNRKVNVELTKKDKTFTPKKPFKKKSFKR